MSRLVPSIAVLLAAAALGAPAVAADYDGTLGAGDASPFRGGYPTEPKDWAGLGDQDDPLALEFSARYWYSLGSQDFSSGGGSMSATDTTHIGELHLRIEDHSTNTYAQALGGYSITTSGSYAGSLTSGTISDGHVGYAGADIGWNALGDNQGSGAGPVLGYLYWQDTLNTGRNNYTTASSAGDIVYDPATGQTFVPGASAPNNIDMHLLRLGIQAKAKLGEFFDVSAELVGVPYAKVSGNVGVDDPSFSLAEYAGPSQLPYSSVANGNISSIRSSPTAIDGWGYGGMAELWLGMHPTQNLTFRLGGRAWYLQGTVDATYDKAQIGNPSDSDPVVNPPNYDTAPTFVNHSFISTANPFTMFRYGVLAEFSYAF